MKHILEYNQLSIFTTVDFTEGGDGVYALYIDGVLFKYGDYYHDKIETWIESFIEGVKWAGHRIESNKIECKNHDINSDVSEMGGIPPKKLEDIQ